jgi:hypothetical protein
MGWLSVSVVFLIEWVEFEWVRWAQFFYCLAALPGQVDDEFDGDKDEPGGGQHARRNSRERGSRGRRKLRNPTSTQCPPNKGQSMSREHSGQEALCWNRARTAPRRIAMRPVRRMVLRRGSR